MSTMHLGRRRHRAATPDLHRLSYNVNRESSYITKEIVYMMNNEVTSTNLNKKTLVR